MADWTDDEDSVMLTMIKEGASAVDIGAKLNRSKNSVIGRAMRTGMKFGKGEISSFRKVTRMSECDNCGKNCKPGFYMCRKCYDKLLKEFPLCSDTSEWADDIHGRIRWHGDLSVVKELNGLNE